MGFKDELQTLITDLEAKKDVINAKAAENVRALNAQIASLQKMAGRLNPQIEESLDELGFSFKKGS